MQPNVLNVLMYLLKYYINHTDDVSQEQDNLVRKLKAAGFTQRDITKAFSWLAHLKHIQVAKQPLQPQGDNAIRLYTHEEMERLDSKCRGFLWTLEDMGLLDMNLREMIIEKVMALDHVGSIELDDLKWIALMVLYHCDAYSSSIQAVLENLLLSSQVDYVH